MNEKVNKTGQALELGCTMLRAIPRDFPEELLLAMQSQSIAIRRLLRDHFDPLPVPFETQYAAWRQFYQEVVGVSLGDWEHEVPERRYGFTRLVIIAGGLDPQVRVGAHPYLSKVMAVVWEDKAARQVIDTNYRGADADRAIWVRDEKIARHMSFEIAQETPGVPAHTMTHLEYVLNATQYRFTTGECLDDNNVVACMGTRWRDPGSVPTCQTKDGVLVIGSELRHVGAKMYVRQVVA